MTGIAPESTQGRAQAYNPRGRQSKEAMMNPSSTNPRHSVADHIYDAIYIGGLGGGIVAPFLLVHDGLAHGDPFFTPSLMGSVLFEGLAAQSVRTVSMEAVAKFTPVHLAAFSVLGLALSWLTHQAEIRSRNPG